MRRFSILLVLLLLATTKGEARQLPGLVPEGWRQQSSDAETRSRRFVSPDGDSTLTTHQSLANPANLRRDIDQIAFHTGEQITYLRRAPTWVAVSGYRDGKIFYRKSNLACRGTRWNQVELVYPRENKRAMDRPIAQIAHGMTEYGRDCH